MKIPARNKNCPGVFSLLFSVLFSASFLISGCLIAERDTGLSDISPLAVGNTWVYVDSSYYGDDSITTSLSETSIIASKNVKIEGKAIPVFLSNSHLPGAPPAAFSNYVMNIGHSNFSGGAEMGSQQITGKVLHLEYPTRNGRRYRTYFFKFIVSLDSLVPALDTIDIEVIDTRATCSVPAGTFNCVHYRGYHKDGSLYADAFHAPGVGYLGSEITQAIQVKDSIRNVRSVRRLVSYTLH